MAKRDTIEKDVATMTDQAQETVSQAIEAGKAGVTSPKQATRSTLEIMEKAPSPLFMGAAAASIIGSLVLWARRDKENAIFVGLWAPTFLCLGLFSNLLGISKEE